MNGYNDGLWLLMDEQNAVPLNMHHFHLKDTHHPAAGI
jgi:hypothetical protein